MEIEDEIRDRILEDINHEKIILLDLGPIYLIVVVWNSEMSSFKKRAHIRKLLKLINVAFDITVLTSDKFDEKVQKIDALTLEVIKYGAILHSKDDEDIAV